MTKDERWVLSAILSKHATIFPDVFEKQYKRDAYLCKEIEMS
jgi:hypothetical protein